VVVRASFTAEKGEKRDTQRMDSAELCGLLFSAVKKNLISIVLPLFSNDYF
jgi:hypothetical protein